MCLSKVEERVKEEDEVDTRRGKVIKFGWIEGVLMRWTRATIKMDENESIMVRCLLNIWGTMLFLRLTWVIGQCGIWQVCQRHIASTNKKDKSWSKSKLTDYDQGLLVITACNIITGLSALSMSAISTNGQIAAGGVYYMISRFARERRKFNSKQICLLMIDFRALGPAIGGSIGIMFTVSKFFLQNL